MRNKLLYIISIILFLIDLISKLFIIKMFNYNKSVTIIKNILYITYVKNMGGAFSIFSGNVMFIIIVTFIVLLFIYKYLKDKYLDRIEVIGYALVIGGALGNLFDRIIYGAVVDFIDIYIFGYDFPVFNIADCGIVIGIILLIIYSFIWESSDRIGNKS